ncbi:MAG: PEGA domain-containing protein [Deltaproteobacteria bacterium]|nr:PEGA domain-containing protein [Deltaproteobacteria bacterium]
MTPSSRLYHSIVYLMLIAILHCMLPLNAMAAPLHRAHQPEVKRNSVNSEEPNNPFELSESAPANPASPPTNDLKPKLEELKKISSKKNASTSLPIAAVLDVYSTSLSGPELREISNSFRREVKNTGRYLVYNKAELRKALSKNLDQEIVAAKQIDEYVSQARRLYDEFKFDAALAIMKEAMRVITTFDATPGVARKISEAYLTQGLILDALNREKEADGSFLNAAALDPDRQLDPTQYPPSVIGRFYKAKSEFPKIKKGQLRIETTPPVVRVVLNDKQLGTTPSTLKDLPLGVQKIALFKDGYDPWEKNVMIVASGPQDYVNKMEVDLSKQGESVSLDSLMGEVISRKDYESQISKLADVGKLMLADQVLAARIEKGDGAYDLFMTQIDASSGHEIAKAYASIDSKLADVDVSLARALEDLKLSKQPLKTTDRIAVEGKGSHYLASYKKTKPFYKRWPFYVILGTVIAGGGAGLAIALTRSGGPGSGSATVGGPPQP